MVSCRTIVLGWLAIASLLFFVGTSVAQAPVTKESSEATHVVFVPYDRMTGPEWGEGESVLVPYARFLELQGTVNPDQPVKYDPVATIAQMNLEGRARDSVVVLDGTLTIHVLAEPDDVLAVPLPFNGAALESLTVDGADALAAPSDSAGVLLRLKGAGARTVHVRFAAPLAQTGEARRLDVGLPRAAASSVRITVDNDVELESHEWNAPAVVDSTEGGGWTIVAAAGGRDRLRLGWSPRVEAVSIALETRLSVETKIATEIAMTRMDLRVESNVTVLAGKTDMVAFEIPSGVRVFNVAGSYVRDWSGPDESGRLTVHLLREMDGAVKVELEGEMEATENLVSVPLIRVANAVREKGVVSVMPDDRVDLWPETASGLQATTPDANVHSREGGRSWRYGAPSWKLVLSRAEIQPTLRSNTVLNYEVTNELVNLDSTHKVTISGRGIFHTRLSVPSGYKVLEANPKQLISGWRQDGESVDINFSKEQSDNVQVGLRLQKTRGSVEEDVELLPVKLEGADEETGRVVLSMPPALRPTELQADGLQSTDVREFAVQRQIASSTEFGDAQPVLGYRFVAPTFKGRVKIERRRTRLTCETAILASIEPTLMRIDATMDWNAEFSATDEFQVLVPAEIGEDVRFDGTGIKEKTRSDETREDGAALWTIRLQRRVLGLYRLNVSYDVPLESSNDGSATTTDVALVRAENVARETGHVAVSRGENLEVRVAESEGLERRDVKELPAKLAGSFFGFRYFDPAAAKLKLELVRHDLDTVLGALIRRLHIETVVNDQREAVHEIWFEIQNNREQYLELKLPKEMSVWSAFVRGVPVRPALRESDGAHLIELAKSETAASAFRVRLILRETLPGGELGTRGTLAFAPPEILNIPVLRTTWKTYLPVDYRYVSFGGTMRHESGRSTPWLAPAAETLLNDVPADAAGGIAARTLHPPVSGAATKYEATESPEEKQARVTATALDIPIVKEGVQFEFSRLSGVGTVEIGFWSKKALLILQGGFALVLFIGLLFASGGSRRPLVLIAAVLAALVAASLLDGLAGRLAATSLITSIAASGVGLVLFGWQKVREAAQRRQQSSETLSFDMGEPLDPMSDDFLSKTTGQQTDESAAMEKEAEEKSNAHEDTQPLIEDDEKPQDEK